MNGYNKDDFLPYAVMSHTGMTKKEYQAGVATQSDQIELKPLQPVSDILRHIDSEAMGYRHTDFGVSTSLFALLGKQVPHVKKDASLGYLGVKITENKMLPEDTMVIMRGGEIVKIIKFEKEGENNDQTS